MTNLVQTPRSDRLRSLVDTVQHNERTLRRFQNVELRLIVAERVGLAVERLELQDDQGERIALTVSVGVAARTIAGGAAEVAASGYAMMEEADRAMYQAKRKGRNRIEARVNAAGAHA